MGPRPIFIIIKTHTINMDCFAMPGSPEFTGYSFRIGLAITAAQVGVEDL